MKLPSATSTKILLTQINKDLFNQTITQLNKDFLLIGLDVNFKNCENSLVLFNELTQLISTLLQQNFNDFLNLLYRIDINETKIITLINSNTLNIEEHISFIILKREWQKVWYKANY